MLQSLVSAIVETLFEMAGAVIVKFFGLESAVELVTALFGLACIVIGVAMFWQGTTVGATP